MPWLMCRDVGPSDTLDPAVGSYLEEVATLLFPRGNKYANSVYPGSLLGPTALLLCPQKHKVHNIHVQSLTSDQFNTLTFSCSTTRAYEEHVCPVQKLATQVINTGQRQPLAGVGAVT